MKALAYFTEKNHTKDTKILVAFSTFDNIMMPYANTAQVSPVTYVW